MKIDAFLTCLGYYGITTGGATSLEGAYSLTSGTTGIFYNQLYSTGAHFVNNQIYAPTLPLVNVYSQCIINNNIFSGVNGLRVGYSHTGNFAMVMDIEYSGCQRNTPRSGMVLLTTAASPSGFNSGFMIGITEANRLYFKTSGYSQTLDRELGVRDFVCVSLAEKKFVTLGIYSLNDNTLYKKDISLDTGILATNDIYLGNFLMSNPADPYIGFSGKVNQVVLFNDSLSDNDTSICANCVLTTGFRSTTGSFSFIAQQFTGLLFSGLNAYAFTGTVNITGKVVTHDGSTLNIITPSGLTGYFQTGLVAIPLFSGVTLSGFRNDFLFSYDTNALNAFSTFNLYFDIMLSSGDSIESYTYPTPNTNIGKIFNGLNWPTDTGYIQVIGNGLNETLGIDYYVSRNQISGFTLADILSYDVIVAPAIVTAYSGYWNDTSKILMSGGGYYPSAPQYLESTGNFSGIVKVTGISGVCFSNPFYPVFGYDLHMNGQKLISGMHYSVVTSGTSGFVVSLSGLKLPPLVVYPIYDITGGGPIAVSSVDDNELAFIPEFSGFQQFRVDVTGDGFTFGPITGFGEQVWVNGIRQLRNLDYKKVYPCSMITGSFNPPVLDFNMYDSTAGNDSLWNLAIPPQLILATGADFTHMICQPTLINPNNYPTDGNCIEVWTSQSVVTPPIMSSFNFEGLFPYSTITISFTGGLVSLMGTGVMLARYHKDNIMGQWTQTPSIIVLNNA